MKRRVMKVLVPKHSVGKKARSQQSKRVETAAMGVVEYWRRQLMKMVVAGGGGSGGVYI